MHGPVRQAALRRACVLLLCAGLGATACSSGSSPAERTALEETPTSVGEPAATPVATAMPADPTAAPGEPAQEPAVAPGLTPEEVRRVKVLLAATLQPADAPEGFRFLSASSGPGQCVGGTEGWIAFESFAGEPLTQRHMALPGLDDTETALAAFRDCGGLDEQVVKTDAATDVIFTARESDFQQESWLITTAYHYQDDVLTQVEGAIRIAEAPDRPIFDLTSDLLFASRDRLAEYQAAELPPTRSAEQFVAAVLLPSALPADVVQLEIVPSSSDLIECLDGYYRFVNQGAPVVLYSTPDGLFFGQASVTVRPDIADLASAVAFFDTVCLEPAEGAFVRATEELSGDTLLAVNRKVATGAIFITAYQYSDGVLTFALADGVGSELLEDAMVDVVALSAAKISATDAN